MRQFGAMGEDGGRVANSMGAPAFTMCDTDRWQGVQTTTQREGRAGGGGPARPDGEGQGRRAAVRLRAGSAGEKGAVLAQKLGQL